MCGLYRPVSARTCRYLPAPAGASPALGGTGNADTRLPRQQPPQLSSNHRACYFDNCGRCPITGELSAALRWLGGGAWRTHLKAAPAAVRATGSRAHGESGRDGSYPGKTSSVLFGGRRGAAAVPAALGRGVPRLIPPQPSGGTRLLPPGPSEPCAHRLVPTPPLRSSQSSPSPWGRTLIDSAGDQSDAPGRKQPRRWTRTRSWRPGPGWVSGGAGEWRGRPRGAGEGPGWGRCTGGFGVNSPCPGPLRCPGRARSPWERDLRPRPLTNGWFSRSRPWCPHAGAARQLRVPRGGCRAGPRRGTGPAAAGGARGRCRGRAGGAPGEPCRVSACSDPLQTGQR